jgi:hypothetical protein
MWKNPQHAFLRRGSKIICPISQLWGKNPSFCCCWLNSLQFPSLANRGLSHRWVWSASGDDGRKLFQYGAQRARIQGPRCNEPVRQSLFMRYLGKMQMTNAQDGVCDRPDVRIGQTQQLQEDHLDLRHFSTKQDTNTCTRLRSQRTLHPRFLSSVVQALRKRHEKNYTCIGT